MMVHRDLRPSRATTERTLANKEKGDRPFMILCSVKTCMDSPPAPSLLYYRWTPVDSERSADLAESSDQGQAARRARARSV